MEGLLDVGHYSSFTGLQLPTMPGLTPARRRVAIDREFVFQLLTRSLAGLVCSSMDRAEHKAVEGEQLESSEERLFFITQSYVLLCGASVHHWSELCCKIFSATR